MKDRDLKEVEHENLKEEKPLSEKVGEDMYIGHPKDREKADMRIFDYKDVAEAVKKLKEELIKGKWGAWKTETIIKGIDKIMGSFDLKKSEENFNENKDVKVEFNHSPQEKKVATLETQYKPPLEDNHSPQIKKGSKPRVFEPSEDNHAQDVCECGHEEKYHFGKEEVYCIMLNCKCKKFKPAQEKKEVKK